MKTATMKKAPVRKLGKSVKQFKADPTKPVQGQAIGTAVIAEGVDLTAPAFPESDWTN